MVCRSMSCITKSFCGKYNIQDNSVSLIECLVRILQMNLVGDNYCFKIDGTIKKINGGTKSIS